MQKSWNVKNLPRYYDVYSSYTGKKPTPQMDHFFVNCFSFDELANLADKIMEVATPTSSISAVSQSQLFSEMEQLRSQISNVQKLVQQLSTSQRRDTPCTRSPSPALQRSQSDLCWYHQKFGDAAKKCREPCSKSGKASASSH